MATNFSPYEDDGEFGIFYVFENAGDGIGMHSHVQKSLQHNTKCIKGSVAIYGDMMHLVLAPGETGVYKSYRQHEIVALEDGTEIVNVFLQGRPEGHEFMSGRTEAELMRIIF